MSEVQTRTCKVCGLNKPRIEMGKYPKGKIKRWVDENGKQWSGLLCPNCQCNRATVNMRQLRRDRKSEKSS